MQQEPEPKIEQIEMNVDPLRIPTSVLIEDPRYRIRPMQQVLSALIGGLITTFVVTPLEVVKTRVQAQAQQPNRRNPVVSKLCYVFHNGLMTHVCKPNETSCVVKNPMQAANMRPVRGAMDAFLKIVCNSGISGLWSGLCPTLVSALPSTIIYFLTYEYLKQSFANLYYMWNPSRRLQTPGEGQNTDPRLTLPYMVPMASGICARTVVVTAITPLEMIRIKMQSGYMTYTELWMVMRSLIKAHGIIGLWRGWPPTVMRDAPFSGTYWAAYESMKRICNVTEPTFWFSFVTGAASGALATLVTMPFDLITTHTQIELGQDVLFSDSSGSDKGGTAAAYRRHPSVFTRLKIIYHQQGVRGLYVGVVPRLLRVVPACAIMISAFEYSKSYFFHHNLDLQEAGKYSKVLTDEPIDAPTMPEINTKPGATGPNTNYGQTSIHSQPKFTMTDPRFRIRPMQQVVSACTGAMITACFMTPLDVIKTRLQAQQSALSSNKCFLYCNGLMDHICPCGPNTPSPTATSSHAFSKLSPPSSHFTGTIDAFVKISRAEGVGSLWSGLSPTLISALPSTIIYFVAYEQLRSRFIDIHYKYLAPVQGSPHSRNIPMLVPLLAGVTARILAVTVVSPFELIRTKMQSKKMTNAEMVSSVRQLMQSHGVLGLWRGLPPTILRDVPFSGIYWTCYEYLKSSFNVVEPSFGFSFVAGAISGSVAATITTPFDVIKTHEQIEFGEKFIFSGRPLGIQFVGSTSDASVCLTPDNPPKSVPTKSVLSRLSTIYRLNGLRGVFSGLGPRLFKVAPACAIMISTFEYSKAFFYHYNVDQHNLTLLVSDKGSK